MSLAERYYRLPKWIKNLVYDLTGRQVIRMEIARTYDDGTREVTSVSYSWSKSRRIR